MADSRGPKNPPGRRFGENHHRAKLTDHEVELIRQLHEEGMQYDALADKFDVSTSTVAKYCRYERRNCSTG